jgi:carbohydrate-selective porin OprB
MPQQPRKLVFFLCCLAVTTAAGQEGPPAAISWSASIQSETFWNSRKPAQILGGISVGATIDLQQEHLGRGTIFAGAQTVQSIVFGRAAEPLQPFSNLRAPSFARFTEAWYADRYWNGRLRLQAGRQYADSQFGTVQNGAPFLNSAFGFIPTTPMPTYPRPEPGVSVWTFLTSTISAGAGLYKNEDGAFTIGEIKADRSGSLPGAYRAGAWRQAGARGLYASADQALTQTIAVFGQWGYESGSSLYAGGGALYAVRPTAAIGMAFARLRVPGSHPETVHELFYRLRLTSHITLQPDVQ